MVLDEKGFATVELIFVTLIVIIIMGSMLTLISSEMDSTQTGEMGNARVLGEKIASTINSVYTNGPGYSINVTIPADSNINASVNNGTGYVDIIYLPTSRSVSIKFIPKNIQNVIMTSNTTDNIYTVSNVNGTITFTQVG